MVHLTVGCGGLCLHNRLSVHWLGLCLLLGLSDFWLGICLALGLSVSMWPCFTMGYLIHVWGVGLFVISICTELLCFWRGIGITCSLLIVFGIFEWP